MAWAAARAATARWLSARVKRNVNGSSSPAMSRNLRRYRPDISCRCWRIAVCISAPSAASIGYFTLTDRPSGLGLPGLHRITELFTIAPEA